MSFSLLSAILLASSATADFNGDAGIVGSAVSVLSQSIAGWNSQSGLNAALQIQSYFPTLVSAVGQLANDAGSLGESDINVNTINSFATGVSSLLAELTNKAADFKAVGTGTIVKNDLVDIGSPSEVILNGIISAVQNNCQLANQLTSASSLVSAGFAAANSAYTAPQLTFAIINC